MKKIAALFVFLSVCASVLSSTRSFAQVACTADLDCVGEPTGTNCECTDATCSAMQCAPVECLCGWYDSLAAACGGNLNLGVDDPDDCIGTDTCNGAGSCLLKDGETTCSGDADCASNNCECSDATCSALVCSPAACFCDYDDVGDGCEGLFLTAEVEDPEDCTGASACDGSGACLLKDSQECTADGECINGNCECADEWCLDPRVCSAVSCATCQYTDDFGLTCAANLGVGIDPNDECTGAGSPHVCNGAGGCVTLVSCPATPLVGCIEPFAGVGRTAVQIKIQDDPNYNRISYWWRKGPATTLAQFGDPVTGTTSYAWCLYDETGGVPVLKSSAVIPPGGQCQFGRRTRPCWFVDSFGRLRFKDRDKANDGIAAIVMKPNLVDGRTVIRVLARGPDADMPTPISSTEMLEHDTDVIVQFRNSDGTCWESVYSAPWGTGGNGNTAVRYLSRTLY